MKTVNAQFLKITLLLLALPVLQQAKAQTCTPQGDQTTYGANNVWIGYVYTGQSFNTYSGYVNEGNSSNPNFDEGFGGDQVNYNTNGCTVYTDGFSVRYKLTKNFTSGNYSFVVGGDDGYRLSLDGGATWAINNWGDHGYVTTTYTTALSGNVNMVLEYYENAGGNRVSFNLTAICSGTGDPSVYGTGNIWNGYIYQGMNFDMYKGMVNEGSAGGPIFDENFGNTGNSNTATYNTNSCSITTYQFSARYRLAITLPAATYTFTVGGDDGFRFSLDGGATWAINKWNDQSYAVASYNIALNGTYNMVLEYFDDGGADRVSFNMTSTTLPVTLVSFAATAPVTGQSLLKWQTTDAVNFDHFVIQRSTDGASFQDIHTLSAAPGNRAGLQDYSYTDPISYNGTLYYRLALADQDGTVTYSRIVTLSQNTGNNDIRMYPTVVENGNLFIESSQPVSSAKLEIFDMNGSRINEKSWSVLQGRQQVSIKGDQTTSLPAGAYIARLSDGHNILAKQIVIVK